MGCCCLLRRLSAVIKCDVQCNIDTIRGNCHQCLIVRCQRIVKFPHLPNFKVAYDSYPKKKYQNFEICEIDLFGLYILFSQYRSCDNTQEVWSFVLFIKMRA